jgi:RNA polymerase sigma-70 factor, ECF subfamily
MTQEEFDAFYTSAFARLVGQIYAMCGNVAEAQDCVQEAFVRAWDKRRTLDVDQAPEAWVRTVAYRLAVSRWRKARRALRDPDRTSQRAGSAEPDVIRVALARALQQLPADQRRAIVLHHLCDLPVSEIASEVGVPAGTIKARLSRGRAALASLLADSEEVSHG